jgi:hypothetical protein
VNLTWLAPAIVAVLTTLGIVINRRYRQPQGRDRVKLDLEILKLLPWQSEVRAELLSHVETSIQRIITVEDRLRRDPAGMAISLIIAMAAGALFYGGSSTGHLWWFLVAAYVLALSVVLFYLSYRRRPRDIAGRAVTEATDPFTYLLRRLRG